LEFFIFECFEREFLHAVVEAGLKGIGVVVGIFEVLLCNLVSHFWCVAISNFIINGFLLLQG
jgi:hypothetical protein